MRMRQPATTPSSLVRWGARDANGTALVCLPWAGAGAGPFQSWGARLEGTAGVYGVRLAGRESRQAEPLPTSLAGMVDEILGDLAALPEPRVALFGLCSGALLAFELARALRDRETPELAHLVVASQVAPRSLPDREGGMALTDDKLLERYLDEEIRAEPELVEIVLPILAADMRMVTGYTYHPAPPLGVPVTVVRGAEDDAVRPDELRGWREETSGPVELVELDAADHLFRGAAWPALADAVRDALSH
jgi:surfactin synthase thioesterase subunit